MARIAVVTSSPPLTEGGHLVIARALVGALRAAGHEADVTVTPQNRFGRQGAAYLANWLTDVGTMGDGQPTDQVISLRFPSYAVRHDHHVCWLNHRMREYYDLWDRFHSGLSWKGRIKEGTRRQIIHAADRYLLTRNVTRLFAQSRSIQARLERWGRIPAEVLYPPAPPRAYRCDGYGDFVFVVSRLTPLKRVDLVLEALAQPVARGVRCVIAGEGDDAPRLHRMATSLDLGARVTFLGRITDAELVDHLARCRAVCFPPWDEDYGFVTVEACAARKPVVTCCDSGGAAELVVDEQNGYITEPTPAALANALARLAGDRALAERMGAAAYEVSARLTWEQTIARLLVV